MKEVGSRTYSFAEYQLDPTRRVLTCEGKTVALNPKAFDLLVALVQHSGQVMTKDELMKRVWQDQFVEEANLAVQVSALRRALGEKRGEREFIATVPGRGYSFIAEVHSYGARRELVVESETTSRYVVEEEIEAGEAEAVGEARMTAPLLKSSGSGLAGLELSDKSNQRGAALQAAPAGTRHKKERLSQTARRVGFVVSSVLFLAAVAGALWLYQSWIQTRQTTQSSPPPQVTTRRFTTHGGVPYRVAISPDGKMLVYLQRIKDKYSLWLGQIETNTSVPLIQEDLGFDNLVFAPDGNTVYFSVRANRREEMLVRMAVLGGVMTELIPRVDSPVTFAPGGKQMAFLRRDDPTWLSAAMIIADADGQHQQTLISRKAPQIFSSRGLSWSPDGKSIAFCCYTGTGREEILLVSVADGSITRLGQRDWGSVERVVWLPDGSGLLAVAAENVGERVLRIWLVSHSSGEARPITDDLNVFLRDNTLSVSSDRKLAVLQGYVHSEIWIAPQGDATRARQVLRGVVPRFEGVDGLAWTPAGRLLYTAYVGNSRVIWSMNSDGSDLRQLTTNRANASDGSICVTADGRYVVFHSNRSGSNEIWRVSPDGSNLKQLTTGGSNSQPSPSADGQWVIYNSSREGKTTLWRISIDGGDATQITDTSSLPEVSPDGHYIACFASASAQLHVIPFSGGQPIRSFEVPARSRMRWTPDGQAIIYPDATQGLWRQELNEEKPQLVKGFEQMTVNRLAWSFDGKNLAYSSGPLTQEIILIENFK